MARSTFSMICKVALGAVKAGTSVAALPSDLRHPAPCRLKTLDKVPVLAIVPLNPKTQEP